MTLKKTILILLLLLICSSTYAQQMRRDDAYLRQRASLEARAKQLGIPVRQVSKTGEVIELQGFTLTGLPLYYTTFNAIAAQTISADRVYPGGSEGLSLTGNGITAGEWDEARVRATHQEFGTRVTQMDAPGSTSSHATHVAGTIIAGGTDTNARGMAYQANLNAYDWNNDATEMSTAAGNGLRVSNHSYGMLTGWRYDNDSSIWRWYGDVSISTTQDYRFGFYNAGAQSWDNIASSNPLYLICKAAGNDRGEGPAAGTNHLYYNVNAWVPSMTTRNLDGNATGYDCIEGTALAKNVLTVGAVNGIAGGYSNPGSVVMSGFSGWGPTDDGRIKPDIVAKGVGMYSTESSADNAYGNKSGTSMATPSVTGAVALLLHHRNNLSPGNPYRASTMKGLIIHTADEAGANEGPDYRFGWGLMNTARASAVMTLQSTQPIHIYENTLTNGGTITIPVIAVGSGTPLRVTICWNDPAGTPVAASLNPTNQMLVNDLDLRLTGPGPTTFFPYILDPANPANAATTGDNTRDNIEMVRIANPVAGGSYTITINHKGALGANQIVSIIVTGNTNCILTCPANIVQSNMPGQCGAVVNFSAPSTLGTCGMVTCVPVSGSFFAKGTTPVTCTANAGPTCSFNVTVNDTEAPSITCPANVVRSNDPNLCGAVVNYAAPTVTDNCPGAGAPVCVPASGSFFVKGTTNVSCSVSDAAGNSASCSFNVIVNDTQPPSITCPANIAVESDQTCNGATVNYPAPTVWDNCPGVTYVCNPPSGSYFPAGNPIQVTTVTCTATDASSNTASCNFTISVEKRPIITPQVTTIVFSFGCKIKTPITKNIVITNTGGHFAGGVLAWNATTGASEITSLTPNGVEGNTMTITVNPGLLANGSYNRTITLTGKNSVTNAVACNSPLTVNVIIIIESNLPTTQSKTVTNAWTQFTNGLGQVMAEMKSNAGNISSVTMSCYPCTYPPNGLSRNRFSKRYYRWTSSASSLNVDMKLYFNGAELSMVTNPSIMQVYQQPVLGGTWYNRGGATDIFLNTVTTTGLTSIAGNFASATIWTIPKRMTLHVLQANYDFATKSTHLIFSSEITPDENGFVIERADAIDAEVWSQVGAVSFDPMHGYQFTEKIAQGGVVYYRISAINNEGDLVESEPIQIETGIGEGMFALEQNYPNPFEAGSRPTMIGYRIGEVTHVTLKVYDALMREVVTLIDEEKSSGRYETRFDASHLPSGVYFYQLVAGKFSQIRKMTLTR